MHRPLRLHFPPLPPLLLLFVFFFSLAYQLPCIISASSSLLNFNVANFAVDANKVELVKEGDWYTGKQQPVIDATGSVWLTPDPRLANSTQPSILGRVVHKGDVDFFLPPEISFSTFFRFTIVTNGSVGTCGSGMAFFISTSKQSPNGSIAAGLGLVVYQPDRSQPLLPSPAPFFAVEFDTHMSPAYRDISASHIGIDLNSLVSVNVTDTNDTSSPLFLYGKYRLSTWVDYNATSHMIEVRVTNDTDRPSSPILTYQASISAIFPPNTPLYVGFSATNRPSTVCPQGAAIHSWDFSSSVSSTRNSGTNTGIGHSLRLVLVITLPIIAVAAIAIATILCLLWKRRTPPPMPRHYSYRTLRKATAGFDDRNKLGEGAHSVVYKGVLPDCPTVVAIKRMKVGVVAIAEEEMRREARIIDAIRHRNLLRMHGWCYEQRNSRREAMLVYEYMSNGSLENFIYGDRKGCLSGEARLRILKAVAAGIEYLHSGLGETILHRDVKAANVLLTDNYEAVVGDFGLARITVGSITMATMAAGTLGYMAPEAMMGIVTTRGDVYSFGVLAMEVACGRRCLDGSLPQEERYVVDWVRRLHEEGKLERAIDPEIRREWAAVGDGAVAVNDGVERGGIRMRRSGGDGRWVGVLWLALQCCHPNSDDRPDMRQVSQALCDDSLKAPSFMSPDTRSYGYVTQAYGAREDYDVYSSLNPR